MTVVALLPAIVAPVLQLPSVKAPVLWLNVGQLLVAWVNVVRMSAPVAVAVTRQMLWRFSAEPTPWGALGVDAALNVHLGASADVREGVAAFIEKRPPNFPGKVSADMPPQVPWWPQR